MPRIETEQGLAQVRGIIDDAGWLSAHHSHAQAARRLSEVLRAVEEHLDQSEKALKAARVARIAPSPQQLLAFERDHRRLLRLVEQALVRNARSEPIRCKACLRRLARSLEAHERRDEALLRRLAPSRRLEGPSRES